MHTQAQGLVGQDLDKKWFNEALLKSGKTCHRLNFLVFLLNSITSNVKP